MRGSSGAFVRLLIAASVAGLALLLAGIAWGSSAQRTVDHIKFKTWAVLPTGTNGYTLSLLPSESGVQLLAQKRSAYASYDDTEGTGNTKKVVANFGALGQASLRFHPKRTTHPAPGRGCTGSVTKTAGTWKGAFKFKGEGGYTKASGTAVKGHTLSVDEFCPPSQGPHQHQYLFLHAQEGFQ